MTTQIFTPDSTGSTASRPASPGVGWRHFNTDTNDYEFFDGSSWLSFGALAQGNQNLLLGRVTAAGGINLSSDGGSGAGFSVSKPSAGIYDITFTGITGNIVVVSQLNDNTSGNYHAVKGATTKSSLTGFPTNLGCRFITVSLNDNTGGGAGIYTKVNTDFSFSFAVFQA